MTTAVENTPSYMLSKEIEILMAERGRLLRVAGAAAQFVAVMESRSLPQKVATEAEILAESVNALPEDTLKDALMAITTASSLNETPAS
ncbi:MAG TPA: hypothetical protein VFJ86_06680 [Usitatibacter sp.]|jgi:hypothetical protein|nr:hypothetical protein [Usitatibacter sp.]